jgi:hypothetical protein
VTNDDIINSLVGRVIVFTAEIKTTENDYVEPGIRARVTGISVDESDKDDQFCTVIVDYSEFDEVNQTFESHDFFNESREPCLTAREAGLYRSTEKIFLPKLSESVDVMFKIDNTYSAGLIERFAGRSDQSLGYVPWLEAMLVECLEQTPGDDLGSVAAPKV